MALESAKNFFETDLTGVYPIVHHISVHERKRPCLLIERSQYQI